MYSSGWSGFQLNGLNSYKLTVRAREVLALYVRRGISCPAGNRLLRAIELAEHVNANLDAGRLIAENDTDLLGRLAESWRTMWDAFVVAHAISQRRPSAAVLTDDLLRPFLEGADLPSDDRNALPRSLQFEAFTAAFLVQSGLAVTRGEPDFRMTFFGEQVGIAVKRLSSIKPGKVYDELRDGARQLRRAKLRGFVSISLDNWISDLGTDRSAEAVGRLFNEQVAEAHRQLAKMASRQVVLGVFVMVNWSQWDLSSGKLQLHWSVPQQVFCFTDDRAEERRYAEFFDPARARWEASLTEIAKLVS